MKRFDIMTREHCGDEFGIKCMNHNGLSGVGKSYEEVEVLGRDFPLIIDKNTRDRFKLKVDTIIDCDNIHDEARRIKRWLLSDIVDKPIKLSDMPNHYFMGFLDNKLDIEEVINQTGACSFIFNCQPFAYVEGGDSPMVVVDGESILNIYGESSRPLIKLQATGDVKFSIGVHEIELRNIGGTIYIDSQIYDTYMLLPDDGVQLQNDKMYSDFPTLDPGDNVFKVISGNLSQIEVTPRWREV